MSHWTYTRFAEALTTTLNSDIKSLIQLGGQNRKNLFRRENSQKRYVFISSSNQQINKNKTKMALNDEQRKEMLEPLLKAGWTMDISGRDAIKKEFKFRDFNQAFGFMTRVAMKAEKMDHHPEWFNVYNRVDVLLSSHDVNGISQRDITMAKAMEAYFEKFQ